MHALRCEGISRSFGGVTALDHCTLEVEAGTIAAIVGPNGAGKTTLFNVVSGFVRPNGGAYFIQGRETVGLSPFRIARLGVARTFQDLRLISRCKVLDNIVIALPGRRESLFNAVLGPGGPKVRSRYVDKAMKSLQEVGLWETASNTAGTLSYGQQKLLSLAMALATGSHLLLLDEPVAGVDPAMRQHISGLLRTVKEKSRTVVFIEHDISTVRDIADQLIVMDQGRVIASGPCDEVLKRSEVIDAYLGHDESSNS